MPKANWRDRYRADDKNRGIGLGKRLREARKEAGLSQTEAAYIAELSQSYVSRAERLGDISFLDLERLAAIYGRSPEQFITPGFFATWSPHRKAGEGLRYGNPDIHTLEEWKHHFRHRRWPENRGENEVIKRGGAPNVRVKNVRVVRGFWRKVEPGVKITPSS